MTNKVIKHLLWNSEIYRYKNLNKREFITIDDWASDFTQMKI